MMLFIDVASYNDVRIAFFKAWSRTDENDDDKDDQCIILCVFSTNNNM